MRAGFPGAGAGGPGGAGGYRFSEDQAQRIFEELFGGGLGGFGSSGMGGGGAGGPRVRVFNSGPSGGGGGGGLGEGPAHALLPCCTVVSSTGLSVSGWSTSNSE